MSPILEACVQGDIQLLESNEAQNIEISITDKSLTEVIVREYKETGTSQIPDQYKPDYDCGDLVYT